MHVHWKASFIDQHLTNLSVYSIYWVSINKYELDLNYNFLDFARVLLKAFDLANVEKFLYTQRNQDVLKQFNWKSWPAQ